MKEQVGEGREELAGAKPSLSDRCPPALSSRSRSSDPHLKMRLLLFETPLIVKDFPPPPFLHWSLNQSPCNLISLSSAFFNFL